MPVIMSGRYLGNLKTELLHEGSGATLRTAAPLDNQGDGSSFSPTDLAAVSLGACMVTTLAIVGERDGIPLAGTRFRVEKHMNAEPRRLGRVVVAIHLPAAVAERDRPKLERAALTCPIERSLMADVERAVTFQYDVV